MPIRKNSSNSVNWHLSTCPASSPAIYSLYPKIQSYYSSSCSSVSLSSLSPTGWHLSLNLADTFSTSSAFLFILQSRVQVSFNKGSMKNSMNSLFQFPPKYIICWDTDFHTTSYSPSTIIFTLMYWNCLLITLC